MNIASPSFSSNLRYPDGAPSRSSSLTPRSAASGRPAPPSSARTTRPDRDGYPCWCFTARGYRHGPLPHAIWGFNGTRRPVPCTLPPPWQATLRSVSPPSVSTASTCRTLTTPPSPRTCAPRLLDCATAGLAVAQMKGEAYLSHRLRLHGYCRLCCQPRLLRLLPRHAQREYIDMSSSPAASMKASTIGGTRKACQWIRELQAGRDWVPPGGSTPSTGLVEVRRKMTLIARDIGNPAPGRAGL